MRHKKYFFILIFFLLVIGCRNENGENLDTSHKSIHKKNVIAIIVDSMTENLIEESLEEHDLPAISFLINHGKLYNNLVAPFPSMSVTIEGTILTGEMPYKHGIPGLTWYHKDEDRLVDYGSSLETIRKIGGEQTYYDFFVNLNNVHLNQKTSTIHEELSKRNISTGSINMLVYRGNENHVIHTPTILKKVGALPIDTVTKGPDFFTFGTFHKPEQLKNDLLPDTLIQRAGLSDYYAREVFLDILNTDDQPEFLLAFFPDIDKKTHKNGPPYTRGFKEIDRHLQKILNVYESWDEALEENIFIIFGDHGQDALVEKETDLKIELSEIYSDYKISGFSEKQETGDISIANNHRMVFINPMTQNISKEEIARAAMSDGRISLAAYLDENRIKVYKPNVSGAFHFKKGGVWRDIYNQSWTIDGDEKILDIEKNPHSHLLTYKDNPDVLNQLYSAVSSQPSSIVLSAEPGYSFYSETAPVHKGGGEHGGIHKNDTLAALIIAGTDEKPKYMRMKDLKSYILSLYKEQ